MKGARGFAVSLLFAFAMFFPLGAESGYLPPNPITPPVVSPPSYAPEGTVSPVEAPVVSLPEVSGLSADNGTGVKGSAKAATTGNKAGSGAANKPGAGTAASNSVKSASKALPDDLSSVSALTLLGLAGDNPLMGALSGSSAEAGGIDALTNLLSGTGEDSKAGSVAGSSGLGVSGSEALKKAITLMQREKAANAPSAPLAAASASSSASAATSSGPRSATIPERVVSGGEIVRFVVNGTDVGKSITALVSSAIARDGSFLLTGDRTYAGGDRWLTETFYLLCRKSGPGTYALYADIAQSQVNANSFLYRLARKTPISGRLEGDMIVFGGKETDWQLDLAIRVFSASVTGRTGR